MMDYDTLSGDDTIGTEELPLDDLLANTKIFRKIQFNEVSIAIGWIHVSFTKLNHSCIWHGYLFCD